MSDVFDPVKVKQDLIKSCGNSSSIYTEGKITDMIGIECRFVADPNYIDGLYEKKIAVKIDYADRYFPEWKDKLNEVRQRAFLNLIYSFDQPFLEINDLFNLICTTAKSTKQDWTQVYNYFMNKYVPFPCGGNERRNKLAVMFLTGQDYQIKE